MTQKVLVGLLAIAIFGTAVVVTSCGKGVTGGTSAQLSFNSTTVASNSFDLFRKFSWFPEALAVVGVDEPYSFGVKFLGAYLAENVDSVTQNNIGEVTKIYLDPACPEDGCPSADTVTTFFDFARSPNEVNAELNGQKRLVKPGTYRYVRMDFCIGGGTRNVRIKKTAADSDYTYFNSNNCGQTSAVMDPPLTIEKGDQVLINLNYSLANTLKNCNAGDVTSVDGTCLPAGNSVSFPAFNPTAKKL